jgi:hypothetical protein
VVRLYTDYYSRIIRLINSSFDIYPHILQLHGCWLIVFLYFLPASISSLSAPLNHSLHLPFNCCLL